jgi:2-polyprenyl-3-methyl-5-hydroxy-6-metoxy-1,4-benzoquinol methylase
MSQAPAIRPQWTAEKNARYYASCRWDMIALVPEGCRSFLDVGCGGGVTGKALKEKFPAAQVTGVEAHPDSAEAAALVLDRVLLRDAEAALDDLLGERFDCLFFGDILEHLVDPWSVLKSYTGLLNPGGVVIASLPNIQHISVLMNLARGRWTYTSRGLLDRTHLRFFTDREARQLLEQANLTPINVHYNYRLVERNKARSEWATRLGRFIPFLRPFFIFQYVYLAKRKAPEV